MSLSCSFFIFFPKICSCCGSGVLRGLYFSRSAGDIEFLCNTDNQYSARFLTKPFDKNAYQIFIELLSTRERYALSSRAINPITEICRIYSSKIFFTGRAISPPRWISTEIVSGTKDFLRPKGWSTDRG